MTDSHFEQLLKLRESETLDFKVAQYPFARASDEAKSELLKDILAFCNAFRRTDAHILIGVREKKSPPSEAVGITQHLSDSDLQQFVCSKTNRAPKLAYESFVTKV
jgi:predicted HTH transcriptional regulator